MNTLLVGLDELRKGGERGYVAEDRRRVCLELGDAEGEVDKGVVTVGELL